MNIIARSIALALAGVLTVGVAAADQYLVVVPVAGKKVSNIGVSLESGPMPAGTLGQPYPGFDFKTVLQVSGDPNYDPTGVSWSIADGALPAGLTLGTDGTLSGTVSPAAQVTNRFLLAAGYKSVVATQVYEVDVAGGQSTPSGGTPTGPTDQPSDQPADVPALPDDAPTPGGATGAGTAKAPNGAVLNVAPTNIEFGTVARQLPTAPVTVTISNSGTASAPLIFQPPAQTQYKVTPDCPTNLDPGASCTATVVFTPTTNSKLPGTFAVGLGGQGISVALDGTGHDSLATLVNLPKKQSYVDFGIVASGQFSVTETVITNSSKYYALGIFGAKTLGGYATQFTVENDCPAVLQPGESCSVFPQYAPTSQGYQSATLQLTMNVSGNARNDYLTGRAAGDLGVTTLSRGGALLPGGGALTVSGSGFLPGAKVVFGSTEAPTTYVSPNQVNTTVPAADAPENTWVQVVNPDGGAATAPKTFVRARSFTQFTTKGPLDFKSQALNVASAWQWVYLRNSSYYPSETFTVTDFQVTGPYQVDPANNTCATGKTIGYGGATCAMRVRFVPDASGDEPGAITVSGSGDSVQLPLTGKGLAWDGTPSGSASSNTDVPYETAMSGNDGVGGATLTKYVDIYFRNTNPAAQLNASFELESGAAFQLYSIYSINNAGNSPSNLGCVSVYSTKSNLCRADVGSGTRPHLQVRLVAKSSVGIGTYTDNLIVRDAAGAEQFRVPLTLDVLYDVTAEPYATNDNSTPLDSISVTKVPLASEAYKDIYLRNVGTQGMLLSRSVSIVNANSNDVYLKSDSLYAINSTTGLRSCAKFVNSTQMTNCLSDDIVGGTYTHQRIRVYYKPMASGARTATLHIDHSGQNGPVDIPVSIIPADFSGVFSGAPGTSAQADVPTLRVAGNYELDATTNTGNLVVYLNSTDGNPLKGYFVLSGPGTDSASITGSFSSVTAAGTNGATFNKNRLESTLMTGTASYPNLRATITVNSKVGQGEYDMTLTYFDAAMQEVTRLPVTISVLNDATPEVSATNTSTVPLNNGVVDFGAASVKAVPSQPVKTLSQSVFLRNGGTIGKLKIDRAVIDDGGAGAFTFNGYMYAFSDASNSGNASCASTLPSSQETDNCTAQDPTSSTTPYKNVKLSLKYSPTAAGTQTGTLWVWHHTPSVQNPLAIPLQGTGAGANVAGEVSNVGASTVVPSSLVFSTTASGASGLANFFIRNPGQYGALYASEISLLGDPQFTLQAPSYKTNPAGSTQTCGSALASDYRSTTACLADAADSTTGYLHMKFTVKCTLKNTDPKGTYNGTLRVVTQGAEQLIPLTCVKQ